ncbi:hypothetical protein IMSAGC003_02597 [Lachnospiraceae bacterium]|jgi:Flp pilus assembly pilin Flp|nr:hypothetical protein IMSAGC003_02597 [Lachnospiraceae bacterium]
MKMWEKVRNWADAKVIGWKNFMVGENAGMGTVEVILIIVVLVGVVIIFKSQITELVESIFSKITRQVNKV